MKTSLTRSVERAGGVPYDVQADRHVFVCSAEQVVSASCRSDRLRAAWKSSWS